MAEYLVLARKYRSTTFDEVVGQEHIAATLKNAIAIGRVAHAFLFAGTRGVGKTTMARILAKALNCLSSDGPTATPCNTCDACRAIARGDDVDVVEIDGASNRGIDDIRELRSNAIYRPARCRYKIYYIDEVHQVTKDAFNALLKTLEEPPPHVKFIFATTEADRLPATILSRCQRFDFRNIPTARIAEHLEAICGTEKVKADKAAIFRIARAAAGSMRDGLSLLDQLLSAGEGTVSEADVVRVLGTPSDERTAEIVGAIAKGHPAGALETLDGLLEAGVTLESAIAAVGEMFRHMMLIAACGPDSKLVELPDSQRKDVAGLAKSFSLPTLVQAVSICQTAARNLRGLSSGRGLVEAALIRLAAAEKFVDPTSVLERLEGLGAGGRAGGPGVPAATARPMGPAGQKKKVLTEGGDAPPAAQKAERPAAAVPADLAWDVACIRDRWGEIVPALGLGAAGGLLSPAVVLGVEGETLRLGYGAAHAGLIGRAERSREAISAALSNLFHRPVQCRFEAGQAPEAPRPDTSGTAYQPSAAKAPAERKPIAVPRNPVISTAERAEVAEDPAVKAVLEHFDGTLADIRYSQAAGQSPEDAPLEEQ